MLPKQATRSTISIHSGVLAMAVQASSRLLQVFLPRPPRSRNRPPIISLRLRMISPITTRPTSSRKQILIYGVVMMISTKEARVSKSQTVAMTSFTITTNLLQKRKLLRYNVVLLCSFVCTIHLLILIILSGSNSL